jgi:hypothetical protein
MLAATLVLASVIATAQAHIGAFTKGMYCRYGFSHIPVPMSSAAVFPIWNLPFDGWWMHGNCRNFPPPPDEFLEVPANGHFMADLAMNSAFTWMAFDGRKRTAWGDGKHHPDDYSVNNTGGEPLSQTGCISTPNLHTKSEEGAAGTVFAIAYKSDIMDIKMEELVVFTVAPNTPYKLEARCVHKYNCNLP